MKLNTIGTQIQEYNDTIICYFLILLLWWSVSWSQGAGGARCDKIIIVLDYSHFTKKNHIEKV